MRPFYVLILISIFSYDISFGQDNNKEQDSTSQIDKTIFVYGCCHDGIFLRYLIGLTHKTNPKICFLPTAAADDERTISFWNSICSNLNLESCVIKTFISSSTEKRSFEEVILSSDAIVVDGGNTLNMLGIWKVQGIDTLLRKAYDRGIILSGGSAGSLCWFKQGYSDSRPKELTIIDGLGFLDYSHSPHYHNKYST